MYHYSGPLEGVKDVSLTKPFILISTGTLFSQHPKVIHSSDTYSHTIPLVGIISIQKPKGYIINTHKNMLSYQYLFPLQENNSFLLLRDFTKMCLHEKITTQQKREEQLVLFKQ